MGIIKSAVAIDSQDFRNCLPVDWSHGPHRETPASVTIPRGVISRARHGRRVAAVIASCRVTGV